MKGEQAMNVREREDFLDAMRKTVRLVKLSQAMLQRARSQCHGELYEQINQLTRQVYELRTKSEWLRYTVLRRGDLALPQPAQDGRQGADRRVGIDRRIEAMRQQLQLLPEDAEEARA
jgi:hypothetical protein